VPLHKAPTSGDLSGEAALAGAAAASSSQKRLLPDYVLRYSHQPLKRVSCAAALVARRENSLYQSLLLLPLACWLLLLS